MARATARRRGGASLTRTRSGPPTRTQPGLGGGFGITVRSRGSCSSDSDATGWARPKFTEFTVRDSAGKLSFKLHALFQACHNEFSSLSI